jgi:NADPH:quinone reductase
MFTRSLFQTPDMIAQHHLLNTVADLIDSKKIKTTLTDVLSSPINAENLSKAHRKLNLVQLLVRLFYVDFELSLLPIMRYQIYHIRMTITFFP